ncbi:Zn metallopeptidase [Only Syngen Nebraska virus 5]|uniref:Zn metallopeptidase n=1 Tax=Only Syngen Nebraska virus 5 TaxID=1917232 RepID=UPI000900AA5D|nr:Zn metallopeptidase [Only Syngen Nebraska virus 5]APC25827.1 Zn metallopeptidase [Only Syngen Nebraska virus 5]
MTNFNIYSPSQIFYFYIYKLRVSSKKINGMIIGNCRVTIPKRHIVKFTREYTQNQAIFTVTQQVVADPIMTSFTSVALSYMITNKKNIINQKFEKVLCRKKVINSAKALSVSIVASVVDAHNDLIMSSVDDVVDNVNFTTHHEIIHNIMNGVFFVLKFVSTIL